MELDNQISCVQGSDMVARIPRLCYGPSRSQTMLYFANSMQDYINPSKEVRKEDRSLKDAISDHFMEGYKERLEGFLDNQDKELSEDEVKELKTLIDEAEDA